MYGTREIAVLSKVAEILSDNTKSPLVPSEDIWKKIFCGAELEDLFQERSPQFHIENRSYGYDKELFFNDKTYNGLYETFKQLEYQPEKIVTLFNEIANRISLGRIFDNDSNCTGSK